MVATGPFGSTEYKCWSIQIHTMALRFSIYGRFRLEVIREQTWWAAYRLDLGKRRRIDELAIPDDLPPDELATYLDDFYHEYAKPGQRVEPIP